MADPYNTTILVPAESYDLTDLHAVKLELGILDGLSDEFLLQTISYQSSVATGYCCRGFAQETIVDEFYACPGDKLILSRNPIVSITSIVEGDATLATSEYGYGNMNGRIWRKDASGNRTGWGSGKITVTYVGGYLLPDGLPREVQRAVIVLVKQAWFDRNREPSLRSETVDGVGSYALFNGYEGSSLPQGATCLLDKFVDHAI